ncbi:MAG: GGDEF domain-containing protein [Gammaproteobacteria bacterium]|nr:GGDEF domain-containing protein [Gammaproteobacteria bacterium]
MHQIIQFFEHLGANYRIYTPEQFADLFSARRHPEYIHEHRATLNNERVRFFATLFAVLMPLWLIIDFLVLPPALFMQLAVIRLVSTLVFLYQAWPGKRVHSLAASRISLGIFLFNLPVTFLTSSYFLAGAQLDNSGLLLAKLYTLLPYMSVAGLGVFPLTVYECLTYAVPLSIVAIGGWSLLGTTGLEQLLPSVWLLFVLVSIVLFSATIQLQYMISLVSRPSYDPLTGALSRRSGLDALVREFQMTLMHNDNFSIALLDLDNVDSIIAEYDYPTYDHAVLQAAEVLQEELRHNDILVRWGEKAFLLILPNTDSQGVRITLERIRTKGIGTLPDGKPVTVSIGIAERMIDKVEDWHDLVELVDQRRDQAKLTGKDRTVFFDERHVPA